MEDVKKNGVIITRVSLFISYILETFSLKQLKNYGLNKVCWELTKYYNSFKSPLHKVFGDLGGKIFKLQDY